jgi:signal transduction histidine kinase
MHQPDDSLSIGSGQTVSIFEDSNHNIWVATNMGLNLFEKNKGTFYRITSEDGLPNNNIQGILEDDNKNLWISTNAGIVKFINGVNNPRSANFRVFNKYDGLISNDFVVRSALRGDDGFMNFGSSRGFTRFHSDYIYENQIPPRIILTDFTLIGQDTRKELPILEQCDINNLPELTLRYNQNNFEVEFAATNYLHPEKNRFEFMLEGYETKWRDAGTLPRATYTNINPGHYTFLVKGTNNDGIWSEQPKSLKIVIVPPLWQTKGFIVALTIFLFALAFYLIRRRFRRIQHQNRELEERITERTLELSETNLQLKASKEEITLQNKELEQHRYRLEELVKERTSELEKAKEKAEHSDRLKTSFMANLSHEIRTPMNAIVGFSNLLAQPDLDDEERKNIVSIISSNSEALLILINDILDISIVETNQLKLSPEWFSVNGLLNELEQYFQMRNDHNIEIKALPEPDTDLQLFNDMTRIRQIISNLLTNAMKFTTQGHIHFGYKTQSGVVTFFVEDTGIGIDAKEVPNIFNAFYKVDHPKEIIYRGTGLGLSLCKRLLQQMKGKIWVESEPGKGSVFFFSLPVEIEVASK